MVHRLLFQTVADPIGLCRIGEQTMTRILLHGANRCPTAISTSPPRTQLTASSAERARRRLSRLFRSSATCQMRLRPHPARSRRADRLRIFDPGCRLRVNATLRRRANHAFPKPDNRDLFPAAAEDTFASRRAIGAASELKARRTFAGIVAKRVCQTSSTVFDIAPPRTSYGSGDSAFC
jgi:hypothetical protein